MTVPKFPSECRHCDAPLAVGDLDCWKCGQPITAPSTFVRDALKIGMSSAYGKSKIPAIVRKVLKTPDRKLMTFDEAIALAKTGRKVARSHWHQCWLEWNTCYNEIWWCSDEDEHSAPYQTGAPGDRIDIKANDWLDVTDNYK